MKKVKPSILENIRDPIILTIKLNGVYEISKILISLHETNDKRLRMLLYGFIKTILVAYGNDSESDDSMTDEVDDLYVEQQHPSNEFMGTSSPPSSTPTNQFNGKLYFLISKIRDDIFLSIIVKGVFESFDNVYSKFINEENNFSINSESTILDKNYAVSLNYYKSHINGTNFVKMETILDPSTELFTLENSINYISRNTGDSFIRPSSRINIGHLLTFSTVCYETVINGLSCIPLMEYKFLIYDTIFEKHICDVLINEGVLKNGLESCGDLFSAPQINLTIPEITEKRLFMEIVKEPQLFNKRTSDFLGGGIDKNEANKKRRKVDEEIFKVIHEGKRNDNVFDLLNQCVKKIDSKTINNPKKRIEDREKLFCNFWTCSFTKKNICISLKDMLNKVEKTFSSEFIEIDRQTILKEKRKYSGKEVTTEMMTMLFLMSNIDLLLNLGAGYSACLLQILANINVHNDMRKNLNIWLTGKSSIGKTFLAKLIHEFSTFHGYSQFQTIHKSAKFYASTKNDFDYSFYIYPEAESQLMDPKSEIYQEVLELMHSDVWRYNVLHFYEGKRVQLYIEHHNRCCFLFCSNHSIKADGELAAARTRLNQLEMTSTKEKTRHSSEKKKQKDFSKESVSKKKKFQSNLAIIQMVLTFYFHSRNRNLLKLDYANLTELPYVTLSNRVIDAFEKKYFKLGSSHSRILEDTITITELFRLVSVVSELFFFSHSKYRNIKDLIFGKSQREIYKIFYEILNDVQIRNTPITQDFIFAMCLLNFELTAKYLPQIIEVIKDDFIKYNGNQDDLNFLHVPNGSTTPDPQRFSRFFSNQENQGKPLYKKVCMNNSFNMFDLNFIEIQTNMSEDGFYKYISSSINSKFNFDSSPEMIKYVCTFLSTKTKKLPFKAVSINAKVEEEVTNGNYTTTKFVKRKLLGIDEVDFEPTVNVDGFEQKLFEISKNSHRGGKESLTICMNVFLLDKLNLPKKNPYDELMETFNNELFYENSQFKEFMFFDNQDIDSLKVEKLIGPTNQSGVRKQNLEFLNKNFIPSDSCFFNWSGINNNPNSNSSTQNDTNIINDKIGYEYFCGKLNKEKITINLNLDKLVRKVYLRSIFTVDNFLLFTDESFERDWIEGGNDGDQNEKYEFFLEQKYEEITSFKIINN